MNLALRKATKAGDIDPAQHDAIVAQLPEPRREDENDALDPESAHYLETWLQFGRPVAVGMMGVMDLRAMQIPGREAWLEREVVAFGDDPEPYRRIWGALDNWTVEQASKMAAASDG